jgi:hypothetical protein
MSQESTVSAETIMRAVEAANAVRAVGGAKPIKHLPAGKPGKTEHCILARAFNFDCEVGRKDGIWYVKFPEDRQAEAEILAEELGTLVMGLDNRRVCLPPDIGQIATDFDLLRLPRRYYRGIGLVRRMFGPVKLDF